MVWSDIRVRNQEISCIQWCSKDLEFHPYCVRLMRNVGWFGCLNLDLQSSKERGKISGIRIEMHHLSSTCTLPETNIAIENPPFWRYLQGNMGIFMGELLVSGRVPCIAWYSSPPRSPGWRRPLPDIHLTTSGWTTWAGEHGWNRGPVTRFWLQNYHGNLRGRPQCHVYHPRNKALLRHWFPLIRPY